MSKIKIGIEAGHGGFDPGAIGPTGLREKDVTLAISLELQKLLEQAGFNVMMVRTTDSAVSGTKDIRQELFSRTSALNNMKVDYVVSIHVNASERREANYISTFIVGTGGEAEKLAQRVQSELVKATGWADGGVRVGNFAMLRDTIAPAILCECGFISNYHQEALLRQNGTRAIIAKAIASGVIEHLGGERVEEKPKTPCTINIKGKEFKGYVQNGVSYFQDAPVRKVIEALNFGIEWDAKNLTVKIK